MPNHILCMVYGKKSAKGYLDQVCGSLVNATEKNIQIGGNNGSFILSMNTYVNLMVTNPSLLAT